MWTVWHLSSLEVTWLTQTYIGVWVPEYSYNNSAPQSDLAESAFLPLLSQLSDLTEFNPSIQMIPGVFTELGEEGVGIWLN